MDKNKSIIGVATTIFLCVTVVTLGQQRQLKGQDINTGRFILHDTPASKARSDKKWRLDQAAIAALDAGDYAEEEEDARQSLSLGVGSGLCQDLLAQALNDQGKDQEAFQVYKVMIVDEKDDQLRNLVPYARLLKSGQWAQAVAVYKEALPQIGNSEMIIADDHFSAAVPQPRELTTALHVAQGLTYIDDHGWGNHLRQEDAMREFDQALRLAPASALTNYYYGFGWKHLDPKSKLKAADAPRAKAALKKAAASDNGDVKNAATEVLRGIE